MELPIIVELIIIVIISCFITGCLVFGVAAFIFGKILGDIFKGAAKLLIHRGDIPDDK